MLQLISGFGVSHAVCIAAQLGLADLLHDGPKRSDELAKVTETHAEALRRVMRALASVGVFAEDSDGRFTLTPVGATLRSDVPGSLRAWARVVMGEESRTAWGNLMHSARTGEIAFDHLFGIDVWAYRARHPATGKIFDEAMGNFIAIFNAAVLASYPFSTFDKVVDVGGGNGSFIVALLQANPAMKGVIFDLPHAAEKAKQRIAETGLAGRCEVVAGDAFAAAPGGGDAYVLSRVIHDWNDERAIAILRNCRRAMHGKSKLLLVERVLPERVENTAAVRSLVISDLQMMVMNGGRERTETDYRALFACAGFTLTRVVPTDSEMNVIEGVPA